jgi:colicin import membrane protein
MLGVNQKGVVKMNTELVVVENLELVPFFTKGDQVESILDRLTQEANSFVAGDLSVKKNRDAVKAEVTKYTKSKTYLEKNGMALSAEYKTIPKTIDANRKLVKDTITDLQVLVRQPLTDWEAEQEAIAAAELAESQAIELAKQKESDQEIAILLDNEFNREAAAVLAKQEADKIAYENQLKAEAVELAKAEALAETARIAAEYAEKERLAVEREVNLKAEALQAEEREKQWAIDAENNKNQQIINNENEKKQRALDAEKADILRKEAIEFTRQQEVKRQQDEQDRLAEDQRKKAADKEHSRFINNGIVQALLPTGITEAQAQQIVVMIAKGQVPNVSISY